MADLKRRAPPIGSSPRTPRVPEGTPRQGAAASSEAASGLDEMLAKLPRDKLETLVRAAADGVTGEELLSLVQEHAVSLDLSVPLTVVIFGATGDLAKKKLFPALYQLVLLGHFPRSVNIVGYGRKQPEGGLEAFLAKQCANIKEKPELPKSEFLSRISFHAGGYDSPESFEALDAKMKEFEGGGSAGGNRLFFLSIPPFIFGTVCTMISEKCRATEGKGFTHLIIEKPFGKDSASFDELNACTSSLFDESQLFRIDHYLGKEIVLNLTTLRFANQMFEPIWNKDHIESVEITFKEDLGTGGRGGYFDGFGIIRDIMQNHLLQVFMFLAIEPPASMTGPDIVKAKVDLLRATGTLDISDGVYLGQFTANSWVVAGKQHSEPGYLDDKTVPEGSKCPTFAAAVLRVENERWSGVPFLMKAGKGLDERMAEVRVKFKPQAYNKLMHKGASVPGNELVMRIQPDEALYLKTFSKMPGLAQAAKPTVMDMKYSTQFEGADVGDAYERMFLNAAKGDGSLFVSSAELVEAWRIFTPLLHQIDEQKPDVVLYPFGSRNPPGFGAWSKATAGVTQSENWTEFVATHGADVEKLTSLFKQMDTDGSGSLDATEVVGLARHFYDGREPTEKKVSEIIARLDKDGDGKVSLDELIQSAAAFQNAFGIPEEDLEHAGW